ncbi:hypothetical protein EMCRGX_G003271 [Ephydatia muelleri]
MDRVLHASRQNKLVPFRSLVTPNKWKAHTADKCEVCQHFEVLMKGGMKKKCDKTNGQTSSESLQSLVAHIGHIAPNTFNFNQGVRLAATQSLSAISHLKCPLCHCILHRPVELPCRSLVCAECIITCLTLSANNTCPCCYDNSPLTASSINAAPEVILSLLNAPPCGAEVNMASEIQRMLSESPEPNVLQIPTGGGRVKVKHLDKVAKKRLLSEAGIQMDILPEKGLAMKADLSIPWRKLRKIRRWLKGSGLSLPSERKMRSIAAQQIDDNLESEVAPFAFPLDSGGEELRSAAHVFIPNLQRKIFQFLEENERNYTLRVFMHGDYEYLGGIYGISGASGRQPCMFCTITSNEIQKPPSKRQKSPNRCVESIISWNQKFLQAGGDAKKVKNFMNCISKPFFNIPLTQVCLPGLHITQGLFTKLYLLFENACHQLDAKLALGYQGNCDNMSSNFVAYIKASHDLNKAKDDFEKATEMLTQLQQNTTYFSIVIGQANPIVQSLQELSKQSMVEVQQAERKVLDIEKIIKEGFKLHDGPFVKGLDVALQNIGVERQQYFGGTFVGNHIHKTLKPTNLKLLCSSIKNVAQQYPVLLMDAQQVADTFEGAFARLGACHSIYDQCFVTDEKCGELDKAIVSFMDYFRTNFPNENISPKMHLLEDHTVEWVRRYNFGFGMLGEQGAESIHRRFNELNTTYSSIRNKEKRLLCVVKEHLVSISPDSISAQPPPTKRAKRAAAV